jgi:thiol-disulfide isomerase/thioredoxin
MPAAPPLPARIGALLASPRRALAEIEARGTGGVADSLWLVLVGALCFRLEDIKRALIDSLSVVGTIQRTLAVVGEELRPGVMVSIAIGLGLLVFAGRGRRDPSRDIELGAACFVPFFTVQAIVRLLSLPVVLGDLPVPVARAGLGVAALWTLGLAAEALRLARARVPATAGDPSPAAPPTPGPTRLRDRVAVTALAVVLGAGLMGNTVALARADRRAPAFALPRIDGTAGNLALGDLRGQVVLLDFWATWCEPCLRMMPTLHDLYGEWHGKGVEFVGINSDGPMTTADEVRAFLRARPLPYPAVVDDHDVGELYRVSRLPHMVLVGRDGLVRHVFTGLTTRGELAEAIRRACNES